MWRAPFGLLGTFLQVGDHLADFDRRPLLHGNFQHPVCFGMQFQDDLVRFQLAQQIVPADAGTVALMPFGQQSLKDRFADFRDFQFHSYSFASAPCD